MLQPGSLILEKYRVERVLGKGGMGIVLAARHVQLGELFAIKTILPEALEDAESVERFLREARACARLKGEHVARVHDVGNLADGTPYMLMEYLQGQDLGDVLDQRGALPLDEAVLYVHQACEAIAEAHTNGIVHRDLKPSNLFLTRRPNGSPCIKMLDFGISKDLESGNKAAAKLTKTGQFMGSPLYMAPEQMADVKAADIRSDIWALGVILYELATGRAPFGADAVTMVITKVLLSQPDPPSTVCPGLSPAFDDVVMRCLDKLPEARYQSARELMTDLEPFVTPSMFGLERSGSYPRVVIPPSRSETAVTLPGSTVLPLVIKPETTPISSNSTLVVGASTIPIRALTETIPIKAASLPAPLPQAIMPAAPVVPEMPVQDHSEAKTAPPENFVMPIMRILPPGTMRPVEPKPSKQIWGRVTLGLGVVIATVIIFTNGFSSPTTTDAPSSISSAGLIASSEAAEPQKPESTTTTPSAAIEPGNDAAPIADAQAPDASITDTNTIPSAARTTTTSTSTKISSPPPISTARRPPTKKIPVRGYDD